MMFWISGQRVHGDQSVVWSVLEIKVEAEVFIHRNETAQKLISGNHHV